MPMQTQTKERMYLLIMVFCLLVCAVLLISVFCDLPLAAVSATGEAHTPVIRTGQVETGLPQMVSDQVASVGAQPVVGENGLEITSEYLESQMLRFIPQSFPASEIEVDISATGGLEFELAVKKADLKNYLESVGVSMGVAHSLALGLLPEALELEAVLQCVEAGKAGIRLDLQSLSVGDKAVEPDFLPASFFDVLSSAVNATLAFSGVEWDNITFAEGAIYLK